MTRMILTALAYGLILTACQQAAEKPITEEKAGEQAEEQAEPTVPQIEFQNWTPIEVNTSTPIPADKKSEIVGGKRDLTDENTMGYKVGDDFPKVLLYREDGSVFDVHAELESGRPIMLVSGSYSCPIFRRKVPFIDSMRGVYGDKIDIYVVYTIEAHPDDVASPYRDSVWLTRANDHGTILVNQARTFGERVETARLMAKDLGIEAEILFDGPDDLFWYQMGQAPVFVYLVDTEGKIAAYQKLLRHQSIYKCLSDTYEEL